MVTIILGCFGMLPRNELCLLSSLPAELTAKQRVAYAELDPRQFESGTSVSKRARISKAGNRYIRQALYMPALVAYRSEPNVVAYYDHLQSKRGLRKMQAIYAVIRKLLHAIYGVLHHNMPFDGDKFFKMKAANT